jgi:hypothetical protein
MQQTPGGRGLAVAPRTGVEAMSGLDADNQPETTHIGAVDDHYRYDGAGERARKLVDKVHVGEQGPYPDAQNSTGPDDPIVKQSDYVLERDELPKFEVQTSYAGGNAIDVCEGGALAESAYHVRGPLDPKAVDPMFVEGAWALCSAEIGEIQRKYHVQFVDTRTGLEAALHVNVNTGEYALSYAGTNDRQGEFKDVIADAAQLYGLSIQHAQALRLAQVVSTYLKGERLTFVGHSLGGGEAMLAHHATGRPASVYNPAWITDATLNTLGVERDTVLSGVTVNILSGEILNALQSNSDAIGIVAGLAGIPLVADMAKAVKGVRGGEGNTIFYTDPTPLKPDDFTLKGMVKLAVERHGMDRVMKAIMAYPDQSRLYKQAPKPVYRGAFVR